ncbi:uncharacterized protein TM35_000471160 [Trypanosoma theileri]|uniref:Uncharacterized protein n=1 Tax=Trypanosoma theileri TaxID=67003 RepID=A0A1X0NI05_9TRYP|nr:uncharacterized protein TM35_000471160 [Trypanosoma theileri]ORC84221.1 hypothetical protein TM35_000471160 [Trypanosoma theileri]
MSVASVCVAAAEAGGHEHSSTSSNSGDKCLPPPETDAAVERDNPRDITKYCDEQRRSNGPPAGSSNGSAHPAAPSPPAPSPPVPSPPIAAGAAGEGSNGSSPSGGRTGANVNTPAVAGAVNAESTATAQPTSPSPESSDTETANGSGTANDGGSSTPAGSEPSNNPSDEESTTSTTTTTTTTNTIPTLPGISNNTIMPNVKGDADSSSSISSSVWMRVPLLIVVTLACILVC